MSSLCEVIVAWLNASQSSPKDWIPRYLRMYLLLQEGEHKKIVTEARPRCAEPQREVSCHVPPTSQGEVGRGRRVHSVDPLQQTTRLGTGLHFTTLHLLRQQGMYSALSLFPLFLCLSVSLYVSLSSVISPLSLSLCLSLPSLSLCLSLYVSLSRRCY